MKNKHSVIGLISFFALRVVLLVFIIPLDAIALSQASKSAQQQEQTQEPSESQLQSNEFNADHYFVFELKSNKPVNLLNLKKIDETFPLPKVAYNRKKHFTGWLNDYRDESCLNIRGLVLESQSLDEVEYGGARGCTVVSGKWYDPYTDSYFKDPVKDLQIDHMVPLKHAYQSGAYEWSKEKRCLYSNFRWSDYHLIPTYGKENSKKSDRSPVGYLPSHKGYVCEYLKNWLKVKAIWNLRVNPSEKKVIATEVEDNECDKSSFRLSAEELNQELSDIEDNIEICTYNPDSI